MTSLSSKSSAPQDCAIRRTSAALLGYSRGSSALSSHRRRPISVTRVHDPWTGTCSPSSRRWPSRPRRGGKSGGRARRRYGGWAVPASGGYGASVRPVSLARPVGIELGPEVVGPTAGHQVSHQGARQVKHVGCHVGRPGEIDRGAVGQQTQHAISSTCGQVRNGGRSTSATLGATRGNPPSQEVEPPRPSPKSTSSRQPHTTARKDIGGSSPAPSGRTPLRSRGNPIRDRRDRRRLACYDEMLLPSVRHTGRRPPYAQAAASRLAEQAANQDPWAAALCPAITIIVAIVVLAPVAEEVRAEYLVPALEGLLANAVRPCGWVRANSVHQSACRGGTSPSGHRSRW